MLHYHVHTIPHERHRYETVGDFWQEGVHTEVRVSAMPDDRMEFAVLIHELIEDFLCKKRGIEEESQIKPFDIAFEAKRQPNNYDEPGDDPSAPYFKEHQFATKIERLVCVEMGLDWQEYTNVVNSL